MFYVIQPKHIHLQTNGQQQVLTNTTYNQNLNINTPSVTSSLHVNKDTTNIMAIQPCHYHNCYPWWCGTQHIKYKQSRQAPLPFRLTPYRTVEDIVHRDQENGNTSSHSRFTEGERMAVKAMGDTGEVSSPTESTYTRVDMLCLVGQICMWKLCEADNNCNGTVGPGG